MNATINANKPVNKPRMVVKATFNTPTYSTFVLPEGLVLSMDDENKEANAPGVWWIKWNTLYYVDKNGDIQEIKPTDIYTDDDMKHPVETDIEEEDE